MLIHVHSLMIPFLVINVLLTTTHHCVGAGQQMGPVCGNDLVLLKCWGKCYVRLPKRGICVGITFTGLLGNPASLKHHMIRLSITHLQDARWSLLNKISPEKTIRTTKHPNLCRQLDACVCIFV